MATPVTAALPAWAVELRDLFRSGSTAQFLLHGNVFDLVPAAGRLLSLPAFLDDVLFAGYDVVLHYDRSRGVRATRGAEDWAAWLEQALGAPDAGRQTMSLIREPGSALELIDRYLLRTLNLDALQREPGARRKKVAVVVEFAEFVVPRGDAVQLGGAFSANVVKTLGWANDPAILHANIVTVFISERLHDMNDLVVGNPHAANIHLPLPAEADMLDYVRALEGSQFPLLRTQSDVSIEVLAARLAGLSRVGARTAIALALGNGRRITASWLAQIKKEIIERECQDLLDFIESPFTLDDVAGLDSVKAWLRDDATLLRRGALRALPMGYLIAGRLGTGKTFIVQCWAGELGIPCVVFKNFRDRWVGATESNLEKIFDVLRAIGQVVALAELGRRPVDHRQGQMRVQGRVAVPGKCLAVAATPVDCSPRIQAAPWRATPSAVSPKLRTPITGLSGLELMSTLGAKFTLTPVCRSSRPISRAAYAVVSRSSSRPSAALPGDGEPSRAKSRVTSPPSSSMAISACGFAV